MLGGIKAVNNTMLLGRQEGRSQSISEDCHLNFGQ